MKKVVIGICTYNRNESLKICLDRISSMKKPDDIVLDIVVVDNSAASVAQKVLVNAAGVGGASAGVHYFSFHGVGIAAVRNEVLRRVKELNPDYVALIDDDEFPCENWLYELYTRIENTDADVVSGPVVFNFVNTDFEPLKVPSYIKNNACFEGKNKRADGRLCKTASTNNVLFKAEILDRLSYWFDEGYLHMTGEDIDFFDRIYKLGCKIVWCKNACVNEFVNPKRCSLAFIWKRSFNNGYLKIFNRKKDRKCDVKTCLMAFFNLIIFTLSFPLSIVCGLTIFFNAFGKFAFSLGAFISLFKSEALVHYKD